MHQHVIRRRALAACVTLLFTAMATTPATRGAAMIATFEGYAEGTSFQPSLLDAPSGIHFVNPTGATNGNFIIEYANQAGPLLVQNNKYLNTSGVAPGNSASFAYQFGFTGVLPQPAKVVELDAIYAGVGTPGSITLTAFNGSDAAVGASAVTVSDAALRQAHLRVESPTVDIARFTLTVSNVSVGYDNVAFPEPAAGVALLLLPLRRRRSARRHSAPLRTHASKQQERRPMPSPTNLHRRAATGSRATPSGRSRRAAYFQRGLLEQR